MAKTPQSSTAPVAQSPATESETYEEEYAETHPDAGYTSLPSIPVTSVDIPEVHSVECKWTYNFYVEDERTNDTGDMGTIDLSDPSDEARQKILASKMPRYVEITLNPTTFTSEDSYLETFASTFSISDNLEGLNFEKRISSNYFSTVKLKDDQSDRSFYYALDSSENFFGISSNTPTEAADALTELGVTGEAAFGPSGQIVREVLSNMQAKGVTYSPTDVREAVASEALNGVRYIDYNVAINNLVIKNVIMGSGEDKTNIYQDELFSVYDQASIVQNASIAAINPGEISSDEWEPTMRAIDTVAIDNGAPLYTPLEQSTFPVGYYLEKYEIIQTAPGNNIDSFEIKPMEPVIINGYSHKTFQDTKIRYGGVYVYFVRTVVLSRFECIQKDYSGESEDQLVRVICPIVSGGVHRKVDCIESIPPNPPQNISFKWDYDNDCLMVFWENSHNPQRDTTRYQIFRRRSIEVPFTIVAELNFDKSTSLQPPVEEVPLEKVIKVSGPRKYYRDLTFGKDSEYIYAVSCQDAHGMTANYSAQFLVSFSRTENKVKTSLISRSGAPKPYPNIYLNRDLFVDTMKDSGHSRMRVFFDPEYYDVLAVKDGTDTDTVESTSQNLIASDYKLQIINVDDQMSKVVNISILDSSGPPTEVSVNQATLLSGEGFSDILDS